MYSMWKIMCFLNFKPNKHIALHQIHKIMFFLATSYDPFKFKVCSMKIKKSLTQKNIPIFCFLSQLEMYPKFWNESVIVTLYVCIITQFIS